LSSKVSVGLLGVAVTVVGLLGVVVALGATFGTVTHAPHFWTMNTKNQTSNSTTEIARIIA